SLQSLLLQSLEIPFPSQGRRRCFVFDFVAFILLSGSSI
ncbi:unnamed protein product, partial [Vitis vinifera]